MQPSEFWRLSFAEWWAEFDQKVAESKRMEEQMARGRKGLGAVPQHKWDEAVRAHKEKMRAKNG